MNKEKKFNLKFLFIFLAFVFCFFIFSTNSKATFTCTLNDKEYNLPDFPFSCSNNKNYVIYLDDLGDVSLYFTYDDSPFYAVSTTSGVYTFFSVSQEPINCSKICYSWGSDYLNWDDAELPSLVDYFTILHTYDGTRSFYTSSDVYDDIDFENHGVLFASFSGNYGYSSDIVMNSVIPINFYQDGYYYYVVFSHYSNDLMRYTCKHIAVSTAPCILQDYGYGQPGLYCESGYIFIGGLHSVLYGFSLDSINNSFVKADEEMNVSSVSKSCKFIYPSSSGMEKYISYCSSDLSFSLDGEPVFQKSPPKIPETAEIQTIQKVEEIPEMIMKIIKMIIPICLMILVTLLLVYLIHLAIYRFL